ncbi:LacI family DNA-binding transcriptional regulator [Aliagarivorans taiwanensis]|uniref:LacI family DNA-binding transcriptional regulator n=1 Tax=Aliagarivorans taiwanensis TaxID=561966 RepID=UPI00047A8841|nr:LacI family DNA-binding transcriptional regulator [Aliagarivorans taiwanensis]
MATIKEVSELAQVSQATVSRVINGHKRVSEANRERVHKAMKELGYRPNSFAQALASNRSNSVGMVVTHISGNFFGPMLHTVEETLRAQGVHLIAASGYDDLEKERDAVRFLLSRQVDALILHTNALPDDELIELKQQGTRVVVINRFIPELAEDCIRLDNELGGYLATKHLLDLGHKKVAHISGPLLYEDARDRFNGYRKALDEHGVEFDPRLIVEGSFMEDRSMPVIEKLFKRDVEFSAVFCGNDNLALQVYDWLSQNNYTPGDQYSVIGFDDMAFARHLRPRLSSIDFPIITMGKLAAEYALDKDSTRQRNSNLRLEPSLMARDSSANRRC